MKVRGSYLCAAAALLLAGCGEGPPRADPPVVRRILEHLGRWQPEAMERSPPLPPEAWPANASLALTYHPVPDIA